MRSDVSFLPGQPLKFVIQHFVSKGLEVTDVLSFGGLSTVLKCRKSNGSHFILKAFFGYYTVCSQFSAVRGELYGYKFYKELNVEKYGYWREQFLQEISILKQLKGNPSYPCLLEADVAGEIPFFTMEEILPSPHVELQSYSSKIDFLKDLFLAVHDLHCLGFVHRDITPFNLIRDASEKVKVLDFGYSLKLSDTKLSLYRQPHFVYWPPEFQKNFNNVTTAADVYSCGVLACEILTGELPRIAMPELSEINSDISEDVNETVKQMLSYNASDRQQSLLDCSAGLVG